MEKCTVKVATHLSAAMSISICEPITRGESEMTLPWRHIGWFSFEHKHKKNEQLYFSWACAYVSIYAYACAYALVGKPACDRVFPVLFKCSSLSEWCFK